jgi:A/G-specific adenine glycosylase
VLDTNVRRFLARVVDGRAHSSGTVTAAERRTATALLPADPQTAARWAVASMELGALVCRARAPRCGDCPVRGDCVWHRAGHPTTKATRAAQRYEGTDRQARGHLLEVLRSTAGAVPAADLTPAWPDSMQRARALDGLVADGLVEPIDGDAYRLPAG